MENEQNGRPIREVNLPELKNPGFDPQPFVFGDRRGKWFRFCCCYT